MSDEYNTEVRRNDPEMRAKVKAVLDVRAQAAAKALSLMEEAYGTISAPAGFRDDDLYSRNVSAVALTRSSLASDSQFLNRNYTETYVGNMVVSELGDRIVELGDRFDEELSRIRQRAGL